MRGQGHGNVVPMGSDQCLVGKSSSSVYGLTKGSIGQLTKSTAIDYARSTSASTASAPGRSTRPFTTARSEASRPSSGSNPGWVHTCQIML